MTKTKLLLVSLLLVFGLGVMAPAALAQAPTEGYGTIINVAPSLYTLRPNSIGDAVGPVFLNFSSGYGTIAGGEVFNITLSQPIVGASDIAAFTATNGNADFCSDANATGLATKFCSAMTITAAGNTLTLTNGTTAIGGWTGGYITIWGLRVSTVGVLPGSYITATVSAALNQSYPISFSTQGATSAIPVNVGEIANTSLGGTVVATSVPANVLTCIGTTGVTKSFTVTVTEQWAGAWTALSDELVLAPYAPTATGIVTNGSDISITISGIPLGATVTPSAPARVTGSQVWGVFTPTSYTGAVANDTTTFNFPLTTTVRQEVEASIWTFTVVTSGPVPAYSPAMTASVTLDPMTPVTKTYPAFTYPVGTLAEEPNYPLAGLTFIGCQTNLLFPYVTNYVGGTTPTNPAIANWDTAIQVANTTSDPFTYNSVYSDAPVPAGATPQDGACTFYVYAAGTASAPRATPTTATPITFTTPVVLSGGITAFMLSTTAAKGTTGGYAIAVCNFQNAVGYAETVDNAGIGDWGVMSSYLAYVIPNPYYEPRSWDAILGEFSIWNPFGCSSCIFQGVSPSARGAKTNQLRMGSHR